jgi:hypothetical protein
MENSAFRQNLDTIPVKGPARSLISIDNGNEVSIEKKLRINKERVFRFGTKPGICMLLWQRIQRQMIPNVMLFFN